MPTGELIEMSGKKDMTNTSWPQNQTIDNFVCTFGQCQHLLHIRMGITFKAFNDSLYTRIDHWNSFLIKRNESEHRAKNNFND